MNNFYHEAGMRIRERRENNNLTREQLAEMAEISSKFLYEIETGQKGFSADTLYRISRALSVNCEYILSGESHNAFDNAVQDALKLCSKSQMTEITQVLKLIYELNVRTLDYIKD